MTKLLFLGMFVAPAMIDAAILCKLLVLCLPGSDFLANCLELRFLDTRLLETKSKRRNTSGCLAAVRPNAGVNLYTGLVIPLVPPLTSLTCLGKCYPAQSHHCSLHFIPSTKGTGSSARPPSGLYFRGTFETVAKLMFVPWCRSSAGRRHHAPPHPVLPGPPSQTSSTPPLLLPLQRPHRKPTPPHNQEQTAVPGLPPGYSGEKVTT